MKPELWDEVNRSRVEWVLRYRKSQELIFRYHTPAFVGQDGVPEPENIGYQFATHQVARLSAMRPRATFSTRRDVAEERVEGLESFHKRWARDTAWRHDREKIILDMQFGTGIAYVSQRPSIGFEQFADAVHTPSAVRLSPGLYGEDISATSTDDVRFKFHRTITDRAPFLTNAETEVGWDKEACEALVEQSAAAARGQHNDKSGRMAIVYETIWCPFERLPDDADGWMDMTEKERSRCHGVIYTYAMDRGGKGLELRMPMPYFGPRQGPYVVTGFMYVPDQVGFLGPLTANDGQIQQLNAQARANDRSAQNKKTGTLVNANTPDAKATVIAMKDGDVIAVPGLDKANVVPVVAGGIDGESRARELELRARVDRGIGLGEASRGEVSGVGTATENAIADQATQTINGLWKMKVRDLDEGVALRVCWFADQDERTYLQTGPGEFVLGGNTPDMQLDAAKRAYANGLFDADTYDQIAQVLGQRIEQGDTGEGGSFDDLEIEVEILGDDAAEAMRMAHVDQLLALGPMLPQIALFTPGLKEYMRAKADMLGMHWIADMYDLDAAKAVAAAMMEAEAPPAEGAKPPTRLKSQGASPSGGGAAKPQPGRKPEAQGTQLRAAGATAKKGY